MFYARQVHFMIFFYTEKGENMYVSSKMGWRLSTYDDNSRNHSNRF